MARIGILALTLSLALTLLLSSICVSAYTLKLYVTYSGSGISGEAYYCAGSSCGVSSIDSGNLTMSVNKLPVNVSLTYRGEIYVFTVAGNGTIELTSLPHVGNITSNVDVHGLVILNTEMPFTVKHNETTVLRFNTTVVISVPEQVIALPGGVYVLKNVNTSGYVTYNNASRRLTFTGDGTARLVYEVMTIFGIPVVLVALGVILVVILILAIARRGSLAGSRRMFRV